MMKLVDLTDQTEYQLPSGLLWTDEYKWSKVVSTVDWSLTGALIVQTGAKLKGRPITLEPADDEMGWGTKALAEQLQTLANFADRKLKLVLDSDTTPREFIVRFRHADTAFEAEPAYRWQTTDPDSWFKITLRLLEVE